MHSLNDNQLAVYEHLRWVLETAIEEMYPNCRSTSISHRKGSYEKRQTSNKQVARIYTEEILDYAYVPICELADDIEATEKTNPDIY